MSPEWWPFSPPITRRTSPARYSSSTGGWSCDIPRGRLVDFERFQPQRYRSATMADNGQKVRDIIEKELGVEREKLTDDASFIEDLGADSLDIVELVMEFEKEFNIDIPDEDAEKLRTVGDAIGYLNQKVGA